MNTDNTAADYFKRCYNVMGAGANDSERVAIWCYDNPPRKPLPTTKGERRRNIYISKNTAECLMAISDEQGIPLDALADAVLLQYAKQEVPTLVDILERHERERAEIRAVLAGRNGKPELDHSEIMEAHNTTCPT